jgi:hypothetical protein
VAAKKGKLTLRRIESRLSAHIQSLLYWFTCVLNPNFGALTPRTHRIPGFDSLWQREKFSSCLESNPGRPACSYSHISVLVQRFIPVPFHTRQRTRKREKN